MQKDTKIYVAGHRGLAGSALVRELQKRGYGNILTRTHGQLDLTDQSAVRGFFEREQPAYVFLAAAKVGGIQANNTYPAEFIYQNLAIELNVIHSAWQTGVQRLLFLGSSCIYPRECPQPMHEQYLLTGSLESTNRPYAVAKIAGIEACSAYNRQYGTRYLAVMPTNLYGPGDTYDLENSHVLPALILKMHEAKVQGKPHVIIWGTGAPRREFLYCDDLADACVFLMELAEEPYRVLLQQGEAPIVNIGCGEDLTILELAHEVATVVGYRGEPIFDPSKPDGTPRKLLDISRLRALGWSARVSLRSGLELAYQDFLVRNAVV